MVSNNDKCKFEQGYNDTRTEEYKEYICNRPHLPNSEFCMFHDDNYFNTNKNEVRESFIAELNRESSKHVPTPIYFIGCHIQDAKINTLHLNRDTYFVNAKFHGDVDLFDVDFGSVNFSEAKFFNGLYVHNVRVNDILSFKKITFMKTDAEIKFENCIFKTTEFSLTDFCTITFQTCTFNNINFIFAKFLNGLIISNCIFKDRVDFSSCSFLKNSKFSFTSFHTNTIFKRSKFTNVVKYDHVDFKEQQLVDFAENLSNVSFIGTDITRIKFDEKTVWGDSDRYSIFDARELIANPKVSNLSSVLAVYRNLRENYEFRLMYEEAGQFFVKEMELKRIYFEDPSDGYKPKIKKWRRYFSLTNGYNILCQYGESFARVSVWAIGIFSTALVYFTLYPDIYFLEQSKPLGDIDYASKLLQDPLFRLETSLERTFASFFQINKDELADYILRILSLPVLGTMFVVLRRRFERRFRH